MDLRFDQLPHILYKPRETYEKIRPDVEAKEGILIAVILITLGSLVSYGIMTATFGEMLGELGPELAGVVAVFSLSQTVFTIALSVIVLLVVALLAGWMTASWEKTEFNREKSIGLVGYSSVIDMVQTILLAIVIAAMVPGVMVEGSVSAATSVFGVIGIIGILFLIWSLWIQGTAVAVANNAETVKGIVSWFVALILVALVVALVMGGISLVGMGAI